MTFLELCHRLRDEVGGDGRGPVTVVNQRDEYLRVVNWVRDAWLEIQGWRPDWQWAMAQASIPVEADQQEVDAPDDLQDWDAASARFDGRRLEVLDWRAFSRLPAVTRGDMPTRVTASIGGTLLLDRAPVAPGTLTFDYWRTPQRLEKDEDVPRLPEQYHMLIVYQAAIQMGYFTNSPNLVESAQRNADRLMSGIAMTQLPRPAIQGPLA